MTNPNDYSPPKTRVALPLHVAMTAAEIRAYWEAHAPQAVGEHCVCGHLKTSHAMRNGCHFEITLGHGKCLCRGFVATHGEDKR